MWLILVKVDAFLNLKKKKILILVGYCLIIGFLVEKVSFFLLGLLLFMFMFDFFFSCFLKFCLLGSIFFLFFRFKIRFLPVIFFLFAMIVCKSFPLS